MLDAGESFLKLFSCLFVSNGFQGPGFGLCQEDAFDGLRIEGLVAKGMVKGHGDVIGVVGFFQVKDEAGMKAAVSGVGLFESGKEGFCSVPEGEESLSDRFKAVADLFRTPVLRFFYGFTGTLRESLMLCHQLDLGAIDEHFMLGGLQGEDIGHVLIGDGVAIGLKVQEPIDAANPQGHFGGIIIVNRQGLKGASFLFHKELQRRTMGRIMDMGVGLFLEPPSSTCP